MSPNWRTFLIAFLITFAPGTACVLLLYRAAFWRRCLGCAIAAAVLGFTAAMLVPG
jgi:hypothetical protein